eukprot:g14861.t1
MQLGDVAWEPRGGDESKFSVSDSNIRIRNARLSSNAHSLCIPKAAPTRNGTYLKVSSKLGDGLWKAAPGAGEPKRICGGLGRERAGEKGPNGMVPVAWSE